MSSKSAEYSRVSIPPSLDTAPRDTREVLERLRQSSLTPMLIVGPPGSGKQYLSKLLHQLTSAQHDAAPFIAVNCSAIAPGSVDAELFGHERDAFPGAHVARRGLVEMAEHGSLYLNEITALPQTTQAKLLAFMDSMKLTRVGGQREIRVDTRVIAASCHEPREQVTTGAFRRDLYHRLSLFQVNVPPLRDRKDEIALLAQMFVRYFAARLKKNISGLSDEALALLNAYTFPGNVRELRSIIERAVIWSSGIVLEAHEIFIPDEKRELVPEKTNSSDSFFSVPLPDAGVPPHLESVERAYVARMLAYTKGRRMNAARLLGISYPTLLKRIHELGLE